jgi:hypothetical protein
LDTLAVSVSVLCDAIPALSAALTTTAPPACTLPGAPVNSTNASAFVLTLFDAIRPPPARPLVCQAVIRTAVSAASASPSLPAVAVSCAACVALISRSPVAVTVVSLMKARAADGVASPSKAVEVSGSPRIASTRLNSRFDGFQPIVLKTATKPNDWSNASIFVVEVATIVAVVAAVTATAPPLTDPSVTLAVASATTMLVTSSPPKPAHVET